MCFGHIYENNNLLISILVLTSRTTYVEEHKPKQPDAWSDSGPSSAFSFCATLCKCRSFFYVVLPLKCFALYKLS